ncbi:hypothetical protein BV911_12485 [Pseudoruegeria sp. SK021]|nr:hypothetical protein BV911_12485 [Pseudoruegeria sp. SK021]
MPEFLVIGAARAGTTAAYLYLRQHPDLFMSPAKEPNFFAFEGQTLICDGPGADYINNSCTDLVAYQALFSAAPDGAICGEASPLYLYAERAPERIAHHIPQAKLIAILRNPAEQAYSHYLYARRQMLEPLDDFGAAIGQEEARLAANWQPLFGYSRFPQYHAQLSRYYARFPAAQIKIVLYEDFEADPVAVMADLYRFIGVSDAVTPDVSYRPNAGGVPRNARFQNFLMQESAFTRAVAAVVPRETRRRIRDALVDRNMVKTAPMPSEARALLAAAQRQDTVKLQDLIDRDLSAWLT